MNQLLASYPGSYQELGTNLMRAKLLMGLIKVRGWSVTNHKMSIVQFSNDCFVPGPILNGAAFVPKWS